MDRGLIGPGIECQRRDIADLDARQPHIGADIEAIDALEPGIELIAVDGRRIGARIGEIEKRRGNRHDDRADQRFDRVVLHRVRR